MNQRRYRDRNSEKINKAVADIFKALDGLTYWDADCALSRVAESLKDFAFVSSLAANVKDDHYLDNDCIFKKRYTYLPNSTFGGKLK